MENFVVVVNFFQSGGIFMYPILLTLALGTAIIIERLVYLSKAKVSEKVLWQKVKAAVAGGRLKEAVQFCEGSRAPLCQVLKSGLEKIHGPWSQEELRGSMEEVILEAVPALERRTHYLPTLANVATLLGLLGTIIGLIQAFSAVAAVDPSQKAALLSKGISVAMNTTAFGLIVAIPIMLCYSFLLSKTHKIIEGIDEITTKFLNLMTTQERGQAERGKGVAAAAKTF
ncbi:MAG TPA: MotA/TolQ/ExbB proton channel family protein [Nitrospiria bacterium]|nr:MotA/TolQ/ExbB proton channel family protein [Nitrospiria bacterium]